MTPPSNEENRLLRLVKESGGAVFGDSVIMKMPALQQFYEAAFEAGVKSGAPENDE